MMILLQLLWLAMAPFQWNGSAPAPAMARHPFYLSVTEVTQNTAEKSLEVSCKFFTDDFEETLRNAYKTKLDINAVEEKATFNRLIPDYINKHLVITADGKPLKLTYVGFENEKESVYCYFEVTGVANLKKLQAVNTLLHDYRNEQINIMHVTVNGRRQSTKLDFPAKHVQFSF